MLERLVKLGNATLDLILPQSCLGCRQEGKVICLSCRSRLPRLTSPFCYRCGLPQNDGKPCPDCAEQNFVIDGIRSVYLFEGLVRKAIHSFKYQNLRTLARPLAETMAEYLKASSIPVEVLIPVPLHPARLHQRGYNQSLLLARELGKLCGFTVESKALIRRKNTPPQTKTISVKERRINMQEVFACQTGDLTNQKVLLIDDVATTGTTLNACATALKQANVASVWGLTVARES
jgi:ComF family protein